MAEQKRQYDVFAGTDSGILKGVEFTSCGAYTKNFPSSRGLSRGNEITAMIWRGTTQKEIFIGHRDKTVSLFDTEQQEYIFRQHIKFGKGKITDLVQMESEVFVGVESGHIGSLFKMEGEKEQKVYMNTILEKSKGNTKNKPSLKCIKPHPGEKGQFATGGCENNVMIWDINKTKRPVFVAKNVENDELDLRVPVSVSGITFLHDNHSIAAVSRHKCVRVYDPRVKRRPMMNIKYEDSPLTSICALPEQRWQVAMGTAHGRVTLFDLRAKIKNRAPVVYKGISGAIKDVAAVSCDPPFVYSVSLDRYIRVHDTVEKKTVHKEYLKSRLTKLLVRST